MADIREGGFYSPWPDLGTNLSEQWDKLRVNHEETKALVRNSVQEVDGNTHVLRGLEQGDISFRNKFRIFYDKTNSSWKLQVNDGTVTVPVWTDYILVNEVGGKATFTGGIDGAGGFYNIVHPQELERVAEAGVGATTTILNPSKLFFNKESGFYLTKIKGEPLVNLANPFGRAKSFSQSGSTWEVNHGFGISPVLVQVYDDQDRVITPGRADVSDPNVAFFYFDSSISGKAIISSGALGAVELRPADTFYLAIRSKDQATPKILRPSAHTVYDDNHFYVDASEDTGQAFISLRDQRHVADHGRQAISSAPASLVVSSGDGDTTHTVELNGTTIPGVIVSRCGQQYGFISEQSGNVFPGLLAARSRGTPGSKASVQNGDNIGTFGASGWDGTSEYLLGGYVAFVAAENFSPSGAGTDIFFSTTPSGSTVTGNIRMKIQDDGKVAIGPNFVTPEQALDVDGKIRAQRGYISEGGFYSVPFGETAYNAGYAQLRLQVASGGSGGGTATDGAWTTYPLNTVATNSISGLSLSSNQITLPAGTYDVNSSILGFEVDAMRTRLRDTDTPVTLLLSMNQNSEDHGPDFDYRSDAISLLEGRFTLTQTRTVELQYFFESAGANTDLGRPDNSGSGEDNIYGQVSLRKIS